MSGTITSLHSTPGVRKPILSIRVRLMLIALIAVAPLMLDHVRLLENSRAERLEAAKIEAVELVKRGAESHVEVINSARSLLQVVARTYTPSRFSREGCVGFADLVIDLPWLRSLSMTDANGRIICSSLPRLLDVDVTDRAYFREVMRTGGFVLSDYLIGRQRHEPTILAAYPAKSEHGSFAGLFVATIDLQWIDRLTDSIASRSGAAVLMVDGKGTIMSMHPNPGGMIGKNIASNASIRNMLTQEDGIADGIGADGVPRIFAFARVPQTQSRLAIGFDERTVLKRIDHAIGLAYLQLGLFGLLVLLAAWFGGEQLIIKPIQAITRTAARLGSGELDVRLSRERWLAEFEPLANAIDDMAQKLAERERQLRATNRHFEELASIDGLCGLANRRALDARLQSDWESATVFGRPIGLLLIDVDHFKMFNDTLGHTEGDSCLRMVAEALASVASGKAQFAARYGGDEFALLLPGADQDEAAVIAERLRQAIENLRIINAGTARGRITVSIGAASRVPVDGQHPQLLVEAADAALYAAKYRGRDTVVIHADVSLVPAS